jgi:hypothetical protein
MAIRSFRRGYAMVKVGFMVEGETERLLLMSDDFKKLCWEMGIEIMGNIFPPHKKQRGKDLFRDAEKIKPYINILRDSGADFIFFIRDQEDLPCITSARQEIAYEAQFTRKIIAVRKIESWFLADHLTMQSIFGERYASTFHAEVQYPERQDKPDELLKKISLQTIDRGIGDRLLFTKKFINNGFSIQQSAKNPNCPSAAYFLKTLEQLSNQ